MRGMKRYYTQVKQNPGPGSVFIEQHLNEQFLCNICTSFMYDEIFQCNNGHILCKNCKNKIRNCPQCRINMIDIRCLYLEKMRALVEVPCKNSVYGCDSKMYLDDMNSHLENTCKYQQYSCPFMSCSWRGPLDGTSKCNNHLHNNNVYQHLKKIHKVSITKCERDSFLLDIKYYKTVAPEPFWFFTIYGKLFVVYVSSHANNECHWIQVFDNKNFGEYTFDIMGVESTTAWKGAIYSVNKSPGNRCAKFSTDIKEDFLDNEGKYQCRIKILESNKFV